nr:MAG TPA: hypothetical protein [Caudoviricetes sp.]
MLRIINGTDISYTKGDTFHLTISGKNAFSENSVLRFVVAEDTESDAVIDGRYNMDSNGKFNVVLTEAERGKLTVNDYLYKLTLISADGVTITQKSGNFRVKWGC